MDFSRVCSLVFSRFHHLNQDKTLYFPCVCRFLTSAANLAWASHPLPSGHRESLFCHPEVTIGLTKAANCAISIQLLSH